MLPNFILFDLDDTLFDHTRSSRIALTEVHKTYAPDLPFEPFATEHHRVLETHHARFLAGEFPLDEARARRMVELFATFNQSISKDHGTEIATLYRTQHQANRALVPGARELLDALQPHARLAIITNNGVVEQFNKLRALDLARYFDTIVISEDVGVTKPDPKIFAIALERLGAKPHEAVMVGDSFSADIMGATNADIASVWLNRKQAETPATTGSFRHIEIASLAPTDAALRAITQAFTNATEDTDHADLETLAT